MSAATGKDYQGVLSSNHIHMFVEIPPKVASSDFMRRGKGCTSRKNRSFQSYANAIGGVGSGQGDISA